MNVLITTNELGPMRYFGGLGTHVTDLVAALRAAGHRVVVVLNCEDEYRDTAHALVDGLDVIEVSVTPLDSADRDRLGIEQRSAELERIVRDLGFRPDVIHNHDYWSFLFASKLSDRLGAPIVSTVHGFALLQQLVDVHRVRRVQARLDARFEREGSPLDWPGPVQSDCSFYRPLFYWIERTMLRRSTRLIYPTAHAAELARSLYASDFDPARSRVVHHGTDLAGYERRDVELPALRTIEAAATAGRKVVVFAGRLEEQKGVRFLLEALPLVRARAPRFHLLVCGTGSLDQALREQAASMGLSDDVTFTGFVPREHLIQVFHRADVGVMPSIWESFGYVAVEMLACGLPVIVTAVAGLDLLVEHERSGYKVPTLDLDRTGQVDVPALADALVAAMRADPATRARMVEEGLRRVRDELSIGAMTARTLDVYAEAIGSATICTRGNA
jgi:glycosyltransferase involved in cell wall biosynthesis